MAPPADLRAILQGRHLPTLDGARAVAVLLVMLYHFGYPVSGDLGVSGFFVLSGFLITWLLLKEHDATGDVSLRDFYMRRTLRIFPAYYCFIIGSYVLDRLLGDPWPAGLAPSAIFYVVNYFNATHGHPSTSIAHAWSLSIEEQFYLIWPFAFLLLARRGDRVLARALVVAIVAVVAWRSYLFLGRDVGTAYVYNALDTRFDNLAIGCLLAVGLRRARVVTAAQAVARSAWLPVLTVLAIGLSRGAGAQPYKHSIGYTVDAALIAILIIQLVQLHRAWQWRWLEHPVVRWLGLLSYPMYLYHVWALGVGHRLGSLPKPAQFLVGALATTAVAAGSYYVIERPFLKLKKHFQRVPAEGAGSASLGGDAPGVVDLGAAPGPRAT